MLDSICATAIVHNAVWRTFCVKLKFLCITEISDSTWLYYSFIVLFSHLNDLYFAVESDRKMKAAKAAFDASVDCGITFFDTAEVYGSTVKDKIISLLAYLFYFLFF